MDKQKYHFGLYVCNIFIAAGANPQKFGTKVNYTLIEHNNHCNIIIIVYNCISAGLNCKEWKHKALGRN